MRIISKFHDYYDVAQAHGADDDLVMLRETVEHKEPQAYRSVPSTTPFTSLLAHFSQVFSGRSYDHDHAYQATRKWSLLRITMGVVLFVGKPYLYFRSRRTPKAEGPVTLPEEVRYIYDLDELNALIMEHGGVSIYERQKVHRWDRNNKHWALIAYDWVNSKSFEALATELKAPIMHLPWYDRCVIYPVLKELQFYKAVEPWQAYQELSMFLGNIAAPDRVPVTIADKDRINQHGFDMKYGFRTRPRNKA